MAEAQENNENEEREEKPPNRSLAEMIGETLREAALLVAVFGWLDRIVQQEPFWGTWAWTVLGVALILYVLGVMIERYRSPE